MLEITKESRLSHEDCNDIAHWFDLGFDFYEARSIENGKEIRWVRACNEEAKDRIAILRSPGNIHAFAWIIPDHKGELPLLDKIYCEKCWRWSSKKQWKKHQEECYICGCGDRVKKGDGHDNQCSKLHWKKSQRYIGHDPEKAKVYKKATDDNVSRYNHFADFEAIPINKKFEICMVVLVTDKMKGKECIITEGKDTALQQFVGHLMGLKGYLWFFYGAKFDALLLLKYCISVGIPIDHTSLMFKGTTLLSFKMKTDKGDLQIKDLWRFTPDTLKRSCKAYEVDLEFSKTDFDFKKVQNWKDFEVHKDEMRDYIVQDGVAMREVFVNYSKTVYQVYKAKPCKYLTRSQLCYGIWSSDCPFMGELYKTPMEFLDKTREFYRGGRVFCGRPAWQSKDWIEICRGYNKGRYPVVLTQAQYDQIVDFLVYSDVNSLYPSAMVNREYPAGKFEWEEIEEGGVREAQLINFLRLGWPGWNLMAAKVSAICPKNLNVPFLMERNEDSEVHQNLFDKTGWWTGMKGRVV